MSGTQDYSPQGIKRTCPTLPGQVVLVLQGGGALGSYQAGVYQALQEAGVEPDWIIGTSIGAITASLIAGNEPDKRLARLQEFWRRVERNPLWDFGRAFPSLDERLSHWPTFAGGIPGFFAPNPLAHLGDCYPLGADKAGYYTTAPLQRTLEELVDFGLLNRGRPRFTVGAAHVRSSQMRYFDSRDGGILSNSPTEAVFDDNPRRDSLIFSVHLWNPVGPDPTTMAEVLNRQKDIQYSSRIATQIARQQQTHRLRHIINELAARLPESERSSQVVRELASYGCQTRMHVVRLQAPRLDRETHTKDIDFSADGIMQRWEAGRAHTKAVLARAPWEGEFDPLSGVILHDEPARLQRAAE